MKINKRTEKEKTTLGKMYRTNDIWKALNSNFTDGSIDEEDNETILRWACKLSSKEQLVYLLEKIKLETLEK